MNHDLVTTDLSIARRAQLRPISDVASDLNLTADDLELYGAHKAKINAQALHRLSSDASPSSARGKLVLVTAITPTPAGEGKTTVTIGLAQALCRLQKRATACVREPSLGPVFGLKGGAAGGGHAQVLPMEDINLHFTGDMHALGSANNLLSALIDNHVHHGNQLGLDVRAITHRRALDINDRALREIIVGLGGKTNGYPRQTGFQITVATEMMAILCLSESITELKQRIGRIVIGLNCQGEPVTAAQIGCHGALTVLLRDAIKPNLVQTLEGTPAFVHGGPFGNIAHGCSSIIATKLALRLSDVVVTEAGFGSDLGFEKYCDIVAAPRPSALAPDAVVLVATVRALKMHGGKSKKELNEESVEAVMRGLANLDRHAANVRQIRVPFVIAINKFSADTDAEIAAVKAHCHDQGWTAAVCDVWGQGGAGGRELGEAVVQALQQPGAFQPIYDATETIPQKLHALATKVYGADKVELSNRARKQTAWLEAHGFDRLPICVAKTQYSFTDDPTKVGAPNNFTLPVRDLVVSAGAGFVVAMIGDMMTMPGLPAHPAALDIDIDAAGQVTGLS